MQNGLKRSFFTITYPQALSKSFKKTQPKRYLFTKSYPALTKSMPLDSDDFVQKTRLLSDPTDYLTQGSITDWSRFPNQILLFSRHSRLQFHGGDPQIFNFPHCVVCVALRSSGVLRVDGNDLNLRSGEAIMIFPFQSHYCVSFDQKEVDWLIITFKLENLVPWEALKARPVSLTEKAQNLLLGLVESSLKQGTGSDNPEHNVAIQCYYLLVEMAKLVNEAPAAPLGKEDIDSIYAQVNNYALRHVNTRFTLAQMAKDLGYSTVHLQRRFHQEHGIYIGQFLQQVRLRSAATLLRGGLAPISEIAECCGFASVYTFSRAFKQSTGLSPRAYRLSAKQTPSAIKFTHPIAYTKLSKNEEEAEECSPADFEMLSHNAC